MYENAQTDFDKVKSIILSCKTKDQLTSAYNLYKLWNKKYQYIIVLVEHPGFIYWDGVLTGILQGMLKQYNNESETDRNTK